MTTDAPITGGSSPRPWGTHAVLPRGWQHRRFIPTPVGNTTFRITAIITGAVHPHARGEHTVEFRETVRQLRFIPTPVGNTLMFRIWM